MKHKCVCGRDRHKEERQHGLKLTEYPEHWSLYPVSLSVCLSLQAELQKTLCVNKERVVWSGESAYCLSWCPLTAVLNKLKATQNESWTNHPSKSTHTHTHIFWHDLVVAPESHRNNGHAGHPQISPFALIQPNLNPATPSGPQSLFRAEASGQALLTTQT